MRKRCTLVLFSPYVAATAAMCWQMQGTSVLPALLPHDALPCRKRLRSQLFLRHSRCCLTMLCLVPSPFVAHFFYALAMLPQVALPHPKRLRSPLFLRHSRCCLTLLCLVPSAFVAHFFYDTRDAGLAPTPLLSCTPVPFLCSYILSDL